MCQARGVARRGGDVSTKIGSACSSLGLTLSGSDAVRRRLVCRSRRVDLRVERYPAIGALARLVTFTGFSFALVEVRSAHFRGEAVGGGRAERETEGEDGPYPRRPVSRRGDHPLPVGAELRGQNAALVPPEHHVRAAAVRFPHTRCLVGRRGDNASAIRAEPSKQHVVSMTTHRQLRRAQSQHITCQVGPAPHFFRVPDFEQQLHRRGRLVSRKKLTGSSHQGRISRSRRLSRCLLLRCLRSIPRPSRNIFGAPRRVPLPQRPDNNNRHYSGHRNRSNRPQRAPRRPLPGEPTPKLPRCSAPSSGPSGCAAVCSPRLPRAEARTSSVGRSRAISPHRAG